MQLNPKASAELRAKDLDPQIAALLLQASPDPEEIIDGMVFACQIVSELRELDAKFSPEHLSPERRAGVIANAKSLCSRHEVLAARLKKLLRDQSGQAARGASVFKPRF